MTTDHPPTDPDGDLPGLRGTRLVDTAGDAQPSTCIVVGVDRDPAGQAALATAVDLAGRLRARVVAVHVVTLGDSPVDPDGPGWEDGLRAALAEEQQQVERALADHPGGWSYSAWHGDPADVLTRVAEQQRALMVVVGRHGTGISDVLHRLVDGSVSSRLVRGCGRPVLVVPHP